MRDRTRWLELCVSMDVLEDTYFSCEAYKRFAKARDKGTIYLVIYGVMQSLFVQQDALEALCKALNYPFKIRDFPALYEARRLRNVSVGHLVNSKRTDSDFYHNFMIQVTMTAESFELHSHGKGGTRLRTIELANLVSQQQDQVRCVLRKVAETMRERELQHRKMFRSERLFDIFEPTNYAMQKVFEAAWKPEHFELGRIMLPTIVKTLDAFVAALTKRDIEIQAYHGIDDALKKLKYPLEKLKHAFARKETLDAELREILAYYVSRKLDDLKEGA